MPHVSHSSPASRRASARLLAIAAGTTLIASVAAIGAAVPAQASAGPVPYTIQGGKFTHASATAGTFSGHFVFNASACSGDPCPTAYSHVVIKTTPGAPSFTAETFGGASIYPLSNDVALQVVAGTPTNRFVYFPFGPGVLGHLGSFTIPVGTSFNQQPSGIRIVANGKIVGSHATLRTSTTSKHKLPRSAKTTVVKSAGVNPNWTGSVRSISVKCTKKHSSLKSSKLCKVTKKLSTGKVTIRTQGYSRVKAKVTIKTKATVTSVYAPQTWTKTWKVK